MNGGAWQGEAERLDRALPELGLARSRSQAAELISAGRVTVNGDLVTKAGLRVAPGAQIAVEGAHHYVSRAALKLLAALDTFGLSPAGELALDVGASTGGFTQVLLERGAVRVLGIDVGHDQLAQSLRDDPRVHLVEGCNARDLTAEGLTEATGVVESPSFVVADLSFISLELVLPAMSEVASTDARFVVLIKPQFEVGRQGISGGIVTEPALAAAAVERVLDHAERLGLFCHGLMPSPITGEHGNQEILALLAREASADQPEWRGQIHAIVHGGGDA
ncbi:MAG: TlyA family RNA methyltransferase [Microbacteriaceae bacterium]|nr:TlyA family RNA methyltransferase [Microbacteriaceae bacterium]